MSLNEDYIPGDLVAVNRPGHEKREGLVIDSYYDSAGRHIVQVQFDKGEYYDAWYPYVRRLVRRTYYTVPRNRPVRTIERVYY